MDFSQLSSSDLSKIAKLLKKKEALQQRVAKINRQLAAFEGGVAAEKPAKGAKRGRRGQVKEAILAAIKAAGNNGVTVPDLAKNLSMKVANVRAWIYMTGKKIGVKAIKRGVYALKG